MTKVTCKHCSKTFPVTDADEQFYQTVKVPKPTHCPDCRAQRRLAWRNERSLYNRNCDLCKKAIISQYPADATYTVYCYDCWYSDKWDATTYGRDYDFTKPFFQQYDELLHNVPLLNLVIGNSENCLYSNYTWQCKNCYLSYDMGACDNVFYSNTMYHATDCFDCDRLREKCELCYMCVNCTQSYQCWYCIDSSNLNNCYFCFDCSGCSDCMFSFNLRNKQYCIANVQYTKEEYEKKAKKLKSGDWNELQDAIKKFQELKLKQIHRFAKNSAAEGSTGNYLEHCNNCRNVFAISGCDNVAYSYEGAAPGGHDYYDDHYSGWGAELSYETLGLGTPYKTKFSVASHYATEVEYAFLGKNNKYCFGVVSLIGKQYCILNKQYSKEEYEALLPKIIAQMTQAGEYGEFFPLRISPFAYNETIAQDNYPMTKEAVANAGARWYEDEVKPTKAYGTITCIECSKTFRLIEAELKYYEAQGLPQPRSCPNCRHKWRKQFVNPYTLWHRQCMCTQPTHGHEGLCATEFETSYSPNRKELVYCENCYQKEVL